LKEKEGGGVHATYVVLIEFNVWVPGFIKDFLIGKVCLIFGNVITDIY